MGELTKRTIEVIKIRLRPIKALLFGILVLAIFSSPLIIGWVFFRLALLLHLANAVGVAVAAAFIGLALWPLYLVGQALERSSQVPRPPAANTAIDEGLRLKLPGDEYRPIIDVWKTTIEVQQHFNDLELRIRSFAVTLVVAVFGAVALAVKEHYLITIHNITFSLGVAACIAAIPGWLAG